MQPDFHRSLADAEGGCCLADIHFFDVSEEHNVTVNLRQSLNCLAKKGSQLLLLKGFGRYLAPTCEYGRRVVAGLIVGGCIERFFAANSLLAQAAERFVSRDRQNPGSELCFTSKEVQVQINLDSSFLRCVFRFGFVLEQRQQQEVDGSLARANQIVEEMALSGNDPADTFGLEFWVRQHIDIGVTGPIL